MASEEPVTSPDQHKPTPRKLWQIGGVAVIITLLLMLFGNNEVAGDATYWIVGVAAGLALILVGEAVLRRNGLRD